MLKRRHRIAQDFRQSGYWTALALVLTAVVPILVSSAGCQWAVRRGHWCDPEAPSLESVRQLHERRGRMPLRDCGTWHLVSAVEAAQISEKNAAEFYFQAALASARCLATTLVDSETHRIACQVHQASVKGLLVATSTGRSAMPSECHFVTSSGQLSRTTVLLHGFAWDAADFQRLIVVESYQTDSLSCVHRRPGIGVPIVVQRCQTTGARNEERYLPERSTFAATAVMRPRTSTADGPSDAEATLELYNPHVIEEIEYGGRRVALAADFSASLAYQAIREAPRLNPIAWFLDANAAGGSEGLYFLEPYQAGKIPIVFVHGQVESMVFVPANHEHVHRHEATVSQMRAILSRHLAENSNGAVYRASGSADPK